MKNKPILFNTDMVKAILASRKTQTRRIVKPQPELERSQLSSYPGYLFKVPAPKGQAGREMLGRKNMIQRCPHGQPGDLLLPAVEIEGYDGKYAAGIDGQIYSRAKGEWRQLKVWRQPKGYQSVTLISLSGKKQSKTVHRLVCEAFYGKPPSKDHQVRHLDGNPDNGIPSNLAWGTQIDNWNDRKIHGNGMDRDKHHAAKFTNDERAHIKWAIETNLCSQRHASRILKVSQGTINNICNYAIEEAPKQNVPDNLILPIILKITDIRIERLHDISEEDAKAEGVPGYTGALFEFSKLWKSVYDNWDANPWVWVIEFDVIQKNINEVLKASS